MKGWRGFALSLLVCGIAACGGGGSAASPAPTPPRTNPRVPLRRPTPRPPRLTTITAASRDDALAVAAPGVLANDSDADGDALTVRLAGNAAHGTLTLQPNGSFSYTPAAGFTGTDAFTYVASDGNDATAPPPP